ncbi:MAG: phosphotransferase [Candidatus Eremiobacterota bacterium]
MSWIWQRRPAPASLEDQGRPVDAVCLAGPMEDSQVALFLEGDGPLPRVHLEGFDLEVDRYQGRARVRFHLPANEAFEDEWHLHIQGDVEPIHVVVRRTRCRIHQGTGALGAQLRSALLWYAWGRFREIFVVRRITTGMTAEVLVVQPFLKAPPVPPELQSEHVELLEGARGGFLLVKSGPLARVHEEWQRILAYVRSWVTPYLAHGDIFLPTQLAGVAEPTPEQATMLGFFLGGGMFRSTTLDVALRETSTPGYGERLLHQVFELLGPWHRQSNTRTLADWGQMLRREPDGRWVLFGSYDFSRPEDCQRFQRDIGGSPRMGAMAHLKDHVLEKLLPLLLDIRLDFSLTHGDLHPRNILVDREDAWLIDFGNTSVAPTCFDYAKLEVYLRRWYFRLQPTSGLLMGHLRSLEDYMLDTTATGETDVSRVAELARGMGVDRDQLLRLVETIVWLRHRADVTQRESYPDQRGYLAVLYLTLLKTMAYAHRKREAPDWVNYHWLYHALWEVEDRLCDILGISRYPRGLSTWSPTQLIERDFLVARGAPARLNYLLESPESGLASLAATRGVVLSDCYHVDLYGEIMFSLALAEELLEGEEAWLEPQATTNRALASLRQQGLRLPDPPVGVGKATVRPRGAGWLERLRQPDNVAVLKWTLVLQCLGKLITRRFSPRAGKLVFEGYASLGAHMLEHQFDELLGDRCPECGARTELLEDDWECHSGHRFARRADEPLARIQRQVSLREELERLVNEGGRELLDELSVAQIYCSLLAAQGLGSQRRLQHLADTVLEMLP